MFGIWQQCLHYVVYSLYISQYIIIFTELLTLNSTHSTYKIDLVSMTSKYCFNKVLAHH